MSPDRKSKLLAAPKAILAFCAVFLLIQTTNAVANPTGRNIIFIAVDDLRNWVNYAGDYAGTVHTPNIDALAGVSTRYLNAYTTMPQCVASRTSVMLGQSPATHGLDRISWGPGDPAYDAIYSDPNILSIPEVMSQNGYHSVTTGKVFNTPIPERWDESGPATILSQLHNPFDAGPDNTFLNPTVLPANEEHPDQTVANWASDFITNYDDPAPFFLAVGLYQPHIPWKVPQWAYDLYPIGNVVAATPWPNDLDDEPQAAVALAHHPTLFGFSQYNVIETANKAADYTQAYLASISHTDAMVGQVMAALAANPLHAANTDVILWSDHGYHLGEKYHWRKNTLWEQSAKVPLLVSSPGNSDYPTVNVATEVSLLDLAATVVDLAGLPPFPQFEGAALHDEANRSPAEIYFNGGKAIVANGWKFIDYDTDVNNGVDDLALYWVGLDTEENANLILPIIKAILQGK